MDKTEKQKQKYHSVSSNSTIQRDSHRNRGQNRYYYTNIHNRLLTKIGTGTSIESGGIKLVVWDFSSHFCESVQSMDVGDQGCCTGHRDLILKMIYAYYIKYLIIFFEKKFYGRTHDFG